MASKSATSLNKSISNLYASKRRQSISVEVQDNIESMERSKSQVGVHTSQGSRSVPQSPQLSRSVPQSPQTERSVLLLLF